MFDVVFFFFFFFFFFFGGGGGSFALILYFDWLLGPYKGQNFEEKKQKQKTLKKSNCRYLNFVFAEIFIEYISMFHVTFSQSFVLIGCWGHIKGKI